MTHLMMDIAGLGTTLQLSCKKYCAILPPKSPVFPTQDCK